MKKGMFLPILLLMAVGSCAQVNSRASFHIPCEGCEALFESPEPTIVAAMPSIRFGRPPILPIKRLPTYIP